jgi:hypothetical protein
MLEAPGRPLKVAILGNSAGVLIAGKAGAKGSSLSYPAALDRATSEGVTFDVSNLCRIAAILPDVAGTWFEPLTALRPDVVVLQFGSYEAFPRWLPRRLVSHLMGNNRRAGKWRNVYWHRAGRLLGWLGAGEGRLDQLVPRDLGGYVSPRRFEAELRHLCLRMWRQLGCRIVLMDCYTPTDRAQVLTQNMKDRSELNRQAIHRVAEELKLEVFPLAGLIETMGRERALGDGLHLNHRAHCKVGEELAAFLACPRVRV